MGFLQKLGLPQSKASILSRKLNEATDTETGDPAAIFKLINDNPMMRNLRWSNRKVALTLIDAGKELVKRRSDQEQTLWNMLIAADLSQSAKVRNVASRERRMMIHKARYEPKY